MATLPKLVYLFTAYFMVAEGLPRNLHKNIVSPMAANDGGIINTVAQSQFTTYTSYGSFGNFDFGDLQYRLNSILFNMLQNLRNNIPVIFTNPRNIFGPYHPDFFPTAGIPNGERTPKYFPTTRRYNRPTPQYPTSAFRPTIKPFPSANTTPAFTTSKPTPAWIPDFPSRGSEETTREPRPGTTTVITDTEEDYDDNTRPIVLKDPSSFKNEVLDSVPNVEHGSVQAGS